METKEYETAINAANRAYFCAISRSVKFNVLQTRSRIFLEMGYYKECLYDAISALEVNLCFTCRLNNFFIKCIIFNNWGKTKHVGRQLQFILKECRNIKRECLEIRRTLLYLGSWIMSHASSYCYFLFIENSSDMI